MVSIHFLTFFFMVYIGNFIQTTYSQKCNYDNNLFTHNGSYAIRQNSQIGVCMQSVIISAYTNKAIIIIFSNININCNGQSNLKVLDSSQSTVYDYCEAKNSNKLFYFLMIKSYYAYLNSFGPVSFSFDLYFIELNPVYTTTSRPIQVTTTSKQFFTTTTTTTLTTTVPTTATTTRRITFPVLITTAASQNQVPYCGLPAFRPTDLSLKIVGGIESIPNSWPWQVLITDNTYRCGASLINNNWVITAAHCLEMSLKRLTATFGDHDIEKRDGSEITIPALKAIKHPKYDESGNRFEFDYDIGLIKLKTPVSFNSKISPICLPNGKSPLVGKTGITTGWGDTKTDVSSNKLRQTTISINPLTVCSSKLSNRQLCAGQLAPNVHDSCQGDSGGPLVVKDSGIYYLAGIVSSGYDDCEGHGIYTNVNAFQSWIIDTISNN